MKRSILFGKYLAAVVAVALIVQTGCKKEKGYYSSKPVASSSGLTAYDYLKSKPGIYDSLLLVVNALGYQQTLADSSVTVFAPSNQSFKIAISNLNTIRQTLGQDPIYLTQLAKGGDGITDPKARNKANRDRAQLDTMVSMYIVRNQYTSNDFAVGDGQSVATVRNNYPMHGQRIYADAEGFMGGGAALIEYADTKRSLFVSNWSKSTTSSVDIKTKNAIVNLMSDDHVFGFDSFVSRMTLIPAPPDVINPKTDSLWVVFPAGSGYYDGQVSSGEIYKNLFDNTVGTKFICYISVQNNWYPTMYWKPKVPTPVNSYSMTSANDSKQYNRNGRAWRVQGTLVDPANDKVPDAQWVTLDVRQDQNWSSNYQLRRWDFNNTVAYKAYRLVLVQTGDGINPPDALFQISEWTMNYQDPNQ
jgi:uncharacterized surface protein with fasciclin (FAS1) repeats